MLKGQLHQSLLHLFCPQIFGVELVFPNHKQYSHYFQKLSLQDFFQYHGRNEGIYESGVFYCKNMFDGLKTMDKLITSEKTTFLEQWKEKVQQWKEPTTVKQDSTQFPHSGIKPVSPPIVSNLNKITRFEPQQIDLNEIWKYLNTYFLQ